MNLPQYQSHKKVRAAKILNVGACFLRRLPESRAVLTHFELTLEGIDNPVEVSYEWQAKHHPESGGYYVVYEDGYTSYSPADAFEGGYTLIDSIPEEITRPFGTCAITGPREDVAFILKHLPDVDDEEY
jgi:hypothetical protein